MSTNVAHIDAVRFSCPARRVRPAADRQWRGEDERIAQFRMVVEGQEHHPMASAPHARAETWVAS